MPSNCSCLRRTNYHNNISDFHHKKLDCKQQFWWSNIFAQMPERNDWALRLATKLMLLPVCSFIFCLLFVFLFYCRLWNGWIDANAAWPCIWYKCRCTAQCTGQKSGTRCANICIRPTHRINHWHKHTKKKMNSKDKRQWKNLLGREPEKYCTSFGRSIRTAISNIDGIKINGIRWTGWVYYTIMHSAHSVLASNRGRGRERGTRREPKQPAKWWLCKPKNGIAPIELDVICFFIVHRKQQSDDVEDPRTHQHTHIYDVHVKTCQNQKRKSKNLSVRTHSIFRSAVVVVQTHSGVAYGEWVNSTPNIIRDRFDCAPHYMWEMFQIDHVCNCRTLCIVHVRCWVCVNYCVWDGIVVKPTRFLVMPQQRQKVPITHHQCMVCMMYDVCI